MPSKVDKDDVIREAEHAAKLAMNRLVRAEEWLHNSGYHAFSTATCNMRTKIEKALHELVDELGVD